MNELKPTSTSSLPRDPYFEIFICRYKEVSASHKARLASSYPPSFWAMTNPSEPGGSKDAHTPGEDALPPEVPGVPPNLDDDTANDPEQVLGQRGGLSEERHEEPSGFLAGDDFFVTRSPNYDNSLDFCDTSLDDLTDILYKDPLISHGSDYEAVTDGVGLNGVGKVPTQDMVRNVGKGGESVTNMADNYGLMVDDASMESEDDRKPASMERGKVDQNNDLGSFSSENGPQQKKTKKKTNTAEQTGGSIVASVPHAAARSPHANDKMGDSVGDDGASIGSAVGTPRRGEYECTKCKQPKKGHVCPHEPGRIRITAKNLESFIKRASKLVKERSTLTLSLPRWFVTRWEHGGEVSTQDEDMVDVEENPDCGKSEKKVADGDSYTADDASIEDEDDRKPPAIESEKEDQNNIGNKGANNNEESDKGSKTGRGNYGCGKCGKPKKGHVCPFEILRRELTPANLGSFINLVTQWVNERGDLILRVPSWWTEEGEIITQDHDEIDNEGISESEDGTETAVGASDIENISENEDASETTGDEGGGENDKSMGEEDNGDYRQ